MTQHVHRDQVHEQANRLEFFQMLLDRMLREVIVDDRASVRHTLLMASMLRVRQAARAVQLLIDAGCVEEILSIGRTVIEVTVNAAYLQHASDREVERYLQFHPESLDRRRAGLRLGNGGGLMQRLGELVLRTPAASKDEPTWTQRSLMERAQVADAASEMPIMAPLVSRCFPKGHAAAHGTIGALGTFVTAVQEGANVRSESRAAEMTEALFAVNLSLLTISLYMDGEFRLGMDQAIDEAAQANYKTRPSLQGR